MKPTRRGIIKYYTTDPQRPSFMAFCHYAVTNPDPLHDSSCRLTRAAYGSSLRARSAQGRPLGLLMAYLLLPDPLVKELHMDMAEITLEQRVAAREYLEGRPNAHVLFEKERPRRPGEPAEP
jgi:hypothetical protein